MSERSGIFAKLRLNATQLRSVAEQRFADAKCLLDSGDKERANGAIYMAGFAIECLLKALILDRHPNLRGKVDPALLSKSDKEAFDLLYEHALDKMLVFASEVGRKLAGVKTKSGQSVWRELVAICEEWTVYVRYSPRRAKLERAREYVETVSEVKKWLKNL